jgi:hypothetical protein
LCLRGRLADHLGVGLRLLRVDLHPHAIRRHLFDVELEHRPGLHLGRQLRGDRQARDDEHGVRVPAGGDARHQR